eukprot:COSAG01_NODE_6369_length_3708_cov_8.188141_4_plen_64_part_00
MGVCWGITGGTKRCFLATRLNIQCIGFEREKTYLEIARKATASVSLPRDRLFQGDVYADKTVL